MTPADIDPFFQTGYRHGYAGRNASVPFEQADVKALLPFSEGFELGAFDRRSAAPADPSAAWAFAQGLVSRARA
jgi:hypothetical protein